MTKNTHKIIIIILLLLIILITSDIILLRAFNPKEIDDVNSELPCSDYYLEKSDILWVIPKYNNVSISESEIFCEYVLSLNKTLGLHGVYHEFEEFTTDRNQEYLQEGITEFEKCFGYKPELFKPPQLKISSSNKELIKNNNLKLKARFNQITHKVYHCDDSGDISNKFIDVV